jgi:hypothetical protein
MTVTRPLLSSDRHRFFVTTYLRNRVNPYFLIATKR